MLWNDHKMVAFDVETSGVITGTDTETKKPVSAYALQPWRRARGDMWMTSASMIRFDATQGLVAHLSQLFPTEAQLLKMLQDVVANDWTVVGWNIAFDIAMLMSYGPAFRDLCFKIRWLDGMLAWRHLEVEPEYEFQSARHKKRRWRLKPEAVQQWIPSFAGLDEDVDFHATDPASLAKLQKYNDRDNVRAWTITKLIWAKLTPAQRRAVLIEAECLPMVAEANLDGISIDRLTVKHLSAKLDQDAADKLAELAPDGMREDIVRSPIKLANLMFNPTTLSAEEVAAGMTPGWQLPVLKKNKSKVEGKEDSRSTDKEVLHELAFIDVRARKVKDYREALNSKGKFCTSVLDALDYNGDGQVRPSAMVFSTYTGRMTVASKQGKGKNAAQIGYALHQMKRGKEYREINCAPEGFDIVEFDAAGQEFRWMAIASNDPTMLSLCMPGEDAHSYMGAAIVGTDYRKMVELVHAEDKVAGQNRYLGKFANLCIAEGTQILTDRGPCSIELVRPDDLVWDGVEFVAHAGVQFSGEFTTITHCGVTATPEHKVLTRVGWMSIEAAAQHGWTIEPAMGQGWSRRTGAAVRIVDGLARRAVREVRRALCSSAVRLWEGTRCQPALSGDRAVDAVQGVRDAATTCAAGAPLGVHGGRQATAEARQRVVPAMSQPEGRLLAQLRRAWDRVSVRIGIRSGGVCEARTATPHISEVGHRPGGQRRSLRAWKLALGYAQGEPRKSPVVKTYDIVNCGPRARFAANGVIVHNSLQYRTSARKLRVKARVDYDIPLEMPEAQRIHATYQRTYPGVPKYWERQIALVKQLGYVETFGGRRVKIEGDWNGTYGWGMGSTAINFRIQGTGACQKYLAMMVIKDYLHRIGGRFLFDLHDGLYLLIPTAHSYRACVDIRQMLDNLPYSQAWGFTPPVPMPWDCKKGKAWGRLKEVKFDD